LTGLLRVTNGPPASQGSAVAHSTAKSLGGMVQIAIVACVPAGDAGPGLGDNNTQSNTSVTLDGMKGLLGDVWQP
jgi:hypothetical protein